MIPGLEHASIGILRVGGRPKLQFRSVVLVVRLQVPYDLRRFADAQDQHAGRQRVQGARMADPLFLQDPARCVHHIVGGHVLRFLYDKDTGHGSVAAGSPNCA